MVRRVLSVLKVVRSVRAWSSSNITLSMYFNHFTFSCFNYVIQKLEEQLNYDENARIQVPSDIGFLLFLYFPCVLQ